MRTPEDVYQNPASPGSLVAALRLWVDYLGANPAPGRQQLTFTLACPGEARATRVAGYLRRQLHCGRTSIHRVDGGHRDEWHVEGITRSEALSLRRVERLFAWLGGAAARHQVELRGIAIR